MDERWMKCRDANLWRSTIWRLSFYHSPRDFNGPPPPPRQVDLAPNRVPKCDIIENEICEIMGFVKIF